ncbi:MAG TPA: transketolase C-terminal domain-containing protein, partial [Acidimicrobiales bacterium]|nr:transketolase C-terminal domain-containing protein [Acidimicrobiales bacterium]
RHVAPEQVGSGLFGRKIRQGDGSVCILAVGKLVEAAEEAAALLAIEDVEATLWDVRVVRPLDPAMVADAGGHGLVVTVEDGIRNGGAGNFIADAIADLKATRQSPPVLNLGVPTAYIPHGKPDRILAQLGLDGPGIAASVLKAVEHEEALADQVLPPVSDGAGADDGVGRLPISPDGAGQDVVAEPVSVDGGPSPQGNGSHTPAPADPTGRLAW